MYWAMPWRVWFAAADATEGACDVCKRKSVNLVRTFQKTNYGNNYKLWKHSLSPYRTDKKAQTFLPMLHKTGLSYKHWLGVVSGDKSKGEFSAPVVQTFVKRATLWSDLDQDLDRVVPHVWAFGLEFEAGQMNLKAWHEGVFPHIVIEKPLQPQYEAFIAALVKSAELVRRILVANLLEGVYHDLAKKTKKGKKRKPFSDRFWEQSPDEAESAAQAIEKGFSDTAMLGVERANSRFWKETQPDFDSTLAGGRSALKGSLTLENLKIEWHGKLRREALAIFDDVAQTAQIADTNARRVAMARLNLERSLRPDSKSLRRILGLGD
jgi:hypothetical protein